MTINGDDGGNSTHFILPQALIGLNPSQFKMLCTSICGRQHQRALCTD